MNRKGFIILTLPLYLIVACEKNQPQPQPTSPVDLITGKYPGTTHKTRIEDVNGVPFIETMDTVITDTVTVVKLNNDSISIGWAGANYYNWIEFAYSPVNSYAYPFNASDLRRFATIDTLTDSLKINEDAILGQLGVEHPVYMHSYRFRGKKL